MRHLVRVMLGLAAAVPLSGCIIAKVPQPTYQVGNPNVPPPPGYRVICESRAGILYPLNGDIDAACAPVIDQRVILRARG